jgi:bifunctional non-homologous end joining protein LigD
VPACPSFIEPCQPVQYDQLPTGPEWIHEIKHDGWRIIARKSGAQVRLWTRQAKDVTASFPGITRAVEFLPMTACVIDGEAGTHDDNGLPDFYTLQSKEGAARAILYAFSLGSAPPRCRSRPARDPQHDPHS